MLDLYGVKHGYQTSKYYYQKSLELSDAHEKWCNERIGERYAFWNRQTTMDGLVYAFKYDEDATLFALLGVKSAINTNYGCFFRHFS